MVTASAAFSVVDKASGTIRKIHTAALALDKQLNKTGDALDQLGTPQRVAAVERIRKAVGDLGDTTRKTTASTTVMAKTGATHYRTLRTAAVADIDKIQRKLRELQRMRATATVDITTRKAEAKITALQQQLNALTAREAERELASMGAAITDVNRRLGATGGGGGPGGGAGGGLIGGVGRFGKVLRMLGPIMAVLLPIIVSLTGALTALIGSLAMAAGGAGAIGAGALSGFVVGLGAIIAVAKPAHTKLKELKTSQDAYNKSVQQFGRDSAQAEKAFRAMNKLRAETPGAARVADNQKKISSQWAKKTAPAQGDYFGILNEFLTTGISLLPTFGRIANKVLGATRAAVVDMLRPFRGSEWRNIFKSMGDMFSRMVGPGMRAFGNFSLFMGRIARAASPMVVRLFQKIEDMTAGWARGAGNSARVERSLGKMVSHARAWGKLGGATMRLLGQLIGGSAPSGRTMVERVTDQFNKWTEWMKDNPAAVGDFFRRAIDAAGKLASALADIVTALWKIGDALMPLINQFSALAGGLADLGALTPLLMGLGAMSTGKMVMGLGGKMLGRGAAAGAAAGAGAGAAPIAGAGAALGGAAKMSSRVGGLAKGALGKVAAPLAIGTAAYDFLSFQGNFGGRMQNVGSGLTFGAIPAPISDTQLKQQGLDKAAKVGETAAQMQRRVKTLEDRLTARHAPLPDSATAYGRNGGRNATPKLVLTDQKERKRIQAELDALKPVLNVRLKVDRQQKLDKSTNDIIEAFGIRGAGPKGRKGLLADYRDELKDLAPDGKRQISHAMAQFTKQLEGGNAQQRRAARSMRRAIVQTYKGLGQDVEVVNGQILGGTRKEWSRIAESMTSKAEKARQETYTAFTAIQQTAVGSLKAMGFGTKDANNLVRAMEKGPKANKVAADIIEKGPNFKGPIQNEKLVNNNATGGRVFHSGGRIGGSASLQDVIPVNNMAAAGELIVNRHTERDINADLSKLGAPTLTQRVTGEKRPHSQAMSNARASRAAGLDYATGGIVSLGNQLRKEGYAIGEHPAFGGVAPVHTKNSYHYRNMALDINADSMPGGETANLNKLYNRLKGMSGVVELLWQTAGHFDHLHVAMGGGSGALPAGMPGGGGGGGAAYPDVSLTAPKSALGGMPGTLVDAAGSLYAAGLQDKLNKALGAAAPGGGGGVTSAGGQFDKAALANLWTGAGGAPGLANLMAAVGLAESGGKSDALGIPTSGGRARGLWQIMWPLHAKRFPGMDPYNPADNAKMAVAIHASQGIGAWEAHTLGMHQKYMETGGRVSGGLDRMGGGKGMPEWGGWHGRGVDMAVHKPTLIGVGDGGAERVKVSRLGDGDGGGGAVVHVSIGKIVNHEEGDIEKIVERELAKIGRRLARGESEMN